MPRKLIERTELYPYHLYARSNNKEWYTLPLSQVFDLYIEQLIALKVSYHFQVHAFVLMGNHFHMIVSTPKANLDQGMQYFMTRTSWAIARLSGRINKIYGARYKWTIIKDARHFALASRYVFQNPLRAGLCNRVEDYPWSSLTRNAQLDRIITKNINGFDEYLPEQECDYLEWLNSRPDCELELAIGKALKKSEFKLSRSPKGKQTEYFYALPAKK